MELAYIIIGISAALAIAAYLTDPFTRGSVVGMPITTSIKAGKLQLSNNNHRLVVRRRRLLAIIKCGTHIMHTRYLRSPRSPAKTVEGIIADIHRLRFDPHKLLLISGDHFSALFVRNLGVFYYPTLDTSFGISQKDWQNRQRVYIQTLGYTLGVFSMQKKLTTTIVPTGRYAVTSVNFYAYPSDTLYGMLYSLAALVGVEQARPYDYAKPKYRLITQGAATILRDTYQDSLATHYKNYRQHVFDSKTGLIKQHIHLSSAKDITKRRCAFYDNVIFWKTTQLAMELGLIPVDQPFLRRLKQRIIKSFWHGRGGYFIEDLSDDGQAHAYYSSDWLIVLATGFLSPANTKERKYFSRSVAYIQAHRIDQPFAIKYQNETRASRQFLAVRLAVASYGGNSIWSFWGMEYLKVLLALAKTESSKKQKAAHLAVIDYHIAAYKQAMLHDGGFAEVYDDDGNLLVTRLYKSIRQTGWVIGFEQVLSIRASLT